jgi:hypothetical protein
MVWSSMEPNVPAATWKARSRPSVSQSRCTRVAPFNTITRAFRETDLKRTGPGVHIYRGLYEELLYLTSQYEANCGRAEHWQQERRKRQACSDWMKIRPHNEDLYYVALLCWALSIVWNLFNIHNDSETAFVSVIRSNDLGCLILTGPTE